MYQPSFLPFGLEFYTIHVCCFFGTLLPFGLEICIGDGMLRFNCFFVSFHVLSVEIQGPWK